MRLSAGPNTRRRLAQGILFFWFLSLSSSLLAQCASHAAVGDPAGQVHSHADSHSEGALSPVPGGLDHNHHDVLNCCTEPASLWTTACDEVQAVAASHSAPADPSQYPRKTDPARLYARLITPKPTGRFTPVRMDPGAGLKPSLFYRLRVLRI